MKKIILLTPLLTACSSIKTPNGVAVNQLGGKLALTQGNMSLMVDNEASFKDGASAVKHGIWGAVVSGGLNNAASVLNTRSLNGTTKAVTNSNNGASIANTASNNATTRAINASNNATREAINASDNALEAALNGVEIRP